MGGTDSGAGTSTPRGCATERARPRGSCSGTRSGPRSTTRPTGWLTTCAPWRRSAPPPTACFHSQGHGARSPGLGALLRHQGIAPLRIDYNEMVEDHDGVCRRILEAVDPTADHSMVPPDRIGVRRQADSISDEWRARFVADEGGDVLPGS
ncbi:MAG: Stf0 family sulfotransferase [Actinomycetes bacterium]